MPNRAQHRGQCARCSQGAGEVIVAAFEDERLVTQQIAAHHLEVIIGFEVEPRHHFAHRRQDVDGTAHGQTDRVGGRQGLEEQIRVFAVLETGDDFLEDLLGGHAIGVQSRHQRTNRDTNHSLHRNAEFFDGFEHAGMAGTFCPACTKNDIDPVGVEFHGNTFIF
ncbi:MAG: hypothetical protein BWY75_02293 [bacterium ADurb.Bin425]|nr:MAG: hypothetical protein BWY75_02293 [bacterium ADurb.Bin425]